MSLLGEGHSLVSSCVKQPSDAMKLEPSDGDGLHNNCHLTDAEGSTLPTESNTCPKLDDIHGGCDGEGADPVIDIVINNVVCIFSTRCHLNLRKIALEGMNVIYRKEQGMVSMKLRRPYTTASIWSSGKITCTGATSEEDSKVAARRFARQLQHLGFPVKFTNFRVVNVLGTCSLPFAIRITEFSRENRKNASYEPELHPGVTYRIPSPKATLKIFSTGSITITAPSVANVQSAIEHIYPLVYEFKMDKAKVSKINQAELDAMTVRNSTSFKPEPLWRRVNNIKANKSKAMNDTDSEDWDSEDSGDESEKSLD